MPFVALACLAACLPDVAGREGFFAAPRALPTDSPAAKELIAAALPHTVKLVLAGEERTAEEAALLELVEQYCGNAEIRAWNEERCAALAGRRCEAGSCRYRHFGNCSGVLVGEGRFLTAAHCMAPLVQEAELVALSRVVWADATGRPGRRLRLGAIMLGKRDFAHGFVGIEDERPVDVALVTIDERDAAGTTFPRGLLLAPRPPPGTALFILGYPRVERRSAHARAAAGYALNFGTPAVSFGRLTEANRQDVPFCAVDDQQEHWSLASECPRQEVGEGAWRGPITYGALLANYDTCNGYSGAPVFDQRGRLVGINSTIAARVDPQDEFNQDTRAVLISIDEALRVAQTGP